MCFKDRHIFHDISNHRFGIAGGTNNNQRFGRKIDMFFIFHDIRRYCLIAELTQFYSDFISGNLIGTASYDRPVFLFLDYFPCRFPNYLLAGNNEVHFFRRAFKIDELTGNGSVRHSSEKFGNVQGKNITGDNL